MATPEGVEIGIFLYGSLEGGLGEGRARRRLSVIVVKKIDVNVNSTGILGIYGQIGANNRSQTANRRFLGRSAGVWDGQKGRF